MSSPSIDSKIKLGWFKHFLAQPKYFGYVQNWNSVAKSTFLALSKMFCTSPKYFGPRQNTFWTHRKSFYWSQIDIEKLQNILENLDRSKSFLDLYKYRAWSNFSREKVKYGIFVNFYSRLTLDMVAGVGLFKEVALRIWTKLCLRLTSHWNKIKLPCKKIVKSTENKINKIQEAIKS